jgi:site-specific DNA-methyltransferase (adenine-specific)
MTYSNPGDLIFDPVMGSGTTAVAALKTGRHFFGCDISQAYVDLANQRLAKARLEMAQQEMALEYNRSTI